MKQKEINLRINNQYQFIQLFNGIFNLTEMEMRVLSLFADIQTKTTENPFSTNNKKKVADLLGKDDFNTLNNYIKRLKDKKAIKEVKDGYLVNKQLIFDGTDQVIFNIR